MSSSIDDLLPNARVVRADAPVGRAGDDLGRDRFAGLVAAQIMANRPEAGLVVAVVGDWGSGKTSVLRMVAEELDERRGADGDNPSQIVVNFNPWLFSGSDQLTALFFLTLARQIQGGTPDRADAADRLQRYGRALGTLRSLPALGGLFGAGADIAAEGARRLEASASLETQREELTTVLRGVNTHIVVLIDDVDRLQSAEEIRDVMRMVKLVGDLPGVTYVLAYDRRPVVAALSSESISGEEYLEKIVQVEHRLPAVSDERLVRMLEAEINSVIAPLPQDLLDMNRWPELFNSVVRPLVRTPRHVRRYGNAMQLSLRLHRDEVDLADQLALAAVATFLPTFHNALPSLSDALLPRAATFSSLFSATDKELLKSRLEKTASGSGQEEVVRAVYSLLFPATRHILNTYSEAGDSSITRQRRVADPEAFATYISAAVPDDGFTMVEIRRILAAMSDDIELSQELNSRDAEELGRLCFRLRAHIADVPPSRAGAVARLLSENARRRFPAWRQSIDDPTRHIEWFVVELIAAMPHDERQEFLSNWGEAEEGPIHKLMVFEIARHEIHSGQTLLEPERLTALNGALADSVRLATPKALIENPMLGRLLYLVGAFWVANDLAALRDLLADDWLFARYLLVYTEPSFGDDPRPLAWRGLEESLGAEWLHARVRLISATTELPAELAEVVVTARRHLAEAEA